MFVVFFVDDNKLQLGLLGCAFGDGTLCVYSVPYPSEVLRKEKIELSDLPFMFDIDPVFEAKSEASATTLQVEIPSVVYIYSNI